MPADQTQLDEILTGIEDLKKKKAKDAWDKLAVIIQLISGVVLVLVGILITYSINRAQRDSARQITEAQINAAAEINAAQRDAAQKTVQAQIENSSNIQAAQAKTSTDIQRAQSATSVDIQEAQASTSKDIANAQARTSKDIASANLDATNRQIASDYLGKLTSTPASDRAAFLEALDVALPPKYSVPLAVRFARPIQLRSDICNGKIHDDNYRQLKEQDDLLGRTVRALLMRLSLKSEGRDELSEVVHSKIVPDAAIADAALRDDGRVFFRVSGVDDFADVFLNRKLTTTFVFGSEAPWIDVTDELVPKQPNQLALLVRNSNAEGASVRLEIRAGLEQYDRVVVRHDWTGEGAAFWILNTLSVDSTGKFHLGGDEIQVVDETRGKAKPCPSTRVTTRIARLG